MMTKVVIQKVIIVTYRDMEMMFEAHKTTCYWFNRHRKGFSRGHHEGPRDQRESLKCVRSVNILLADYKHISNTILSQPN